MIDKTIKISIKKRSILFCMHTLGGGGAEKLLIDILQRIDVENFDVDLCVLTRWEGVYFDAIPDDVNCFIYEDNHSFPPKKYDIEIAFLEGLATKLVALHRTDAVKIAWVHADLYDYHCSKSYYHDIHEESLCYNMMDEIIFVSHAAMHQFERLMPKVTTKKQVIYNLIDKTCILLKSKSDIPYNFGKKMTLCTIGRLSPEKGYVRLIPVLKKLQDAGLDFYFLIIGEGHQRNQIQNLIQEFNLEDTVFLLGFQENPYAWLKNSDIYVSVSCSEGFSLVVGEALCLGKPIVATKVPAVAELLGHGMYGMLVDQDEDSIYDGLKEMMSNKSLRTIYAEKAKDGAKTDIFNNQENLKKINDLLLHAMSPKTPLEKASQRLIADNEVNGDIGLIHGKMGKAIFFFHYAQFTDNDLYEHYAVRLIKEVVRMIHNKIPCDYENGLTGIGVGFEYLSQNGFIENNTDELLKDFDELLFEATFSNFSLLNGYMGCARYWTYRMQNSNRTLDGEHSIVEKAMNKILDIIESCIFETVSDNELFDIYRSLYDMKRFLQFAARIEKIIDKKEIKYLDLDVKPSLLNGIIAESLCLISSQNQKWQWINLL